MGLHVPPGERGERDEEDVHHDVCDERSVLREDFEVCERRERPRERDERDRRDLPDTT
jgi:hypothetical protein